MGAWPLDGPAYKQLAGFYVLLVAIGIAIGWILVGPLQGSSIASLDSAVALQLEARRTPMLDALTDIGSALAGTSNVVAALVILMAGMAWYWRRWRESLTLGIALALEALVFVTVSWTVGRERPPVEQLDISPPTASFPSGHTGAAFSLYFALALILFWNTDNLLARAAATIGACLLPISVAVSRLYRGMHYLTDVVVGAGLGVACLFIAAGVVTRATARTDAVRLEPNR